MCYLETTRRCNLKCPFCMTNSPQTSDNELTLDEIKHNVIDELKKYSSKAAIAFSGGEFLLREDALDILSYNSSKNMWSYINTNGILIEKDLVNEVRKATDKKSLFVLSLDSLMQDKDTIAHENRLDHIEEKTAILKEMGVPYFFVVTVTKKNKEELKDILAYATKTNIPVLRSPMVPRGRGDNYKDLLFDKNDMRDYIHPALRENYLSYVSFVPFFTAPKFFQKNWLKSKIAIKQLGCQAGRGYIGISAEGNVAPCVHLLDTEVNCGNIRETPLLKILKENKILKELRTRENLQGKCGRCKYKDACGGCRALSYYHNGHYLAEDPTCFFEPESPKDSSEFEAMQNENVGKFADYIIKNSPWKDFF